MADKLTIAAIAIAAVSLCTAAASVCLSVSNTDRITQMAVTAPTEAEPFQPDAIQYVMYVGTNDKDTYQPEYTPEEAMQIVDAICLDYFDGYTLQEATGSWKDEKDHITHEYTIVCYFDGAEEEDVYRAADDIIAALNQNTVLIEQKEIRMDYYTTPGTP